MVAVLELPRIGHLESIEPQMETIDHSAQQEILLAILRRYLRGRKDFFIGSNASVYFSAEQLKNKDFRGPDIFVVKNPKERKDSDRNSWVVWEEDGRYPDLVIELLSESTAHKDRGIKKDIYQNTFRMPEYFYFSPSETDKTKKNEFAGFRLVSGEYQPIQPSASGLLWSEVLGLYLGVSKGDFLGEYRELLRFYLPDGTLVPHPLEAEDKAEAKAELERQGRELERQQREQAEARAEQAEAIADRERQEKELERQQRERAEAENEALRQRLRAAGIDPDSL